MPEPRAAPSIKPLCGTPRTSARGAAALLTAPECPRPLGMGLRIATTEAALTLRLAPVPLQGRPSWISPSMLAATPFQLRRAWSSTRALLRGIEGRQVFRASRLLPLLVLLRLQTVCDRFSQTRAPCASDKPRSLRSLRKPEWLQRSGRASQTRERGQPSPGTGTTHIWRDQVSI